ncbi:hypothetical protein AaE_013795, partial [Aphanomyces astaci]
ATSKELLEIEAKRQDVMLERRKTQQYHQVTQGLRNSGDANGKTKFRMTLRSAGVIGVPAIRRPKLTSFREFHFSTDSRALVKQTKESLKRKMAHAPVSSSPGRPTQRRRITGKQH